MVRYGGCWSCGYEGRARSWGSGGRIAEGVRGVEANRRNGGGRSGSGESDREGKGKGDDPASGWKRGSSDLGVGYVEFCDGRAVRLWALLGISHVRQDFSPDGIFFAYDSE